MRRNIKPQWGEEKVIDLWQTSDDGLIGRVGEIIASKYLWAQGLDVLPFGEVVVEHLFSSQLTKEQAGYLQGCYSRLRLSSPGWRSFDLVGVRRRNRQSYLIEVKTTRSERYRYDSRKFPGTEQRLEAKSVGFKLLLVIVRLVDNRKFAIASRELG